MLLICIALDFPSVNLKKIIRKNIQIKPKISHYKKKPISRFSQKDIDLAFTSQKGFSLSENREFSRHRIRKYLIKLKLMQSYFQVKPEIN